jgi:hypothetical protein
MNDDDDGLAQDCWFCQCPWCQNCKTTFELEFEGGPIDGKTVNVTAPFPLPADDDTRNDWGLAVSISNVLNNSLARCGATPGSAPCYFSIEETTYRVTLHEVRKRYEFNNQGFLNRVQTEAFERIELRAMNARDAVPPPFSMTVIGLARSEECTDTYARARSFRCDDCGRTGEVVEDFPKPPGHMERPYYHCVCGSDKEMTETTETMIDE